VQVPRLPGSAHDRQVPVQLLRQQTPCWQSPEPQSTPVVQVSPGCFLVQTLFRQTLGATQSVSAPQAVRHWPDGPHWKGAHEPDAAVWQTPAPLQVRPGICVEPAHVGPAQPVPAA
jgi:hypothetical protein